MSMPGVRDELNRDKLNAALSRDVDPTSIETALTTG
jgi:hypothetical protein